MTTAKVFPKPDFQKSVNCPRCGKSTKEWRTTFCYSSDKSTFKTCLKAVCEDCIVYSPERHRSECVDCNREIDHRIEYLRSQDCMATQ